MLRLFRLSLRRLEHHFSYSFLFHFLVAITKVKSSKMHQVQICCHLLVCAGKFLCLVERLISKLLPEESFFLWLFYLLREISSFYHISKVHGRILNILNWLAIRHIISIYWLLVVHRNIVKIGLVGVIALLSAVVLLYVILVPEFIVHSSEYFFLAGSRLVRSLIYIIVAKISAASSLVAFLSEPTSR